MLKLNELKSGDHVIVNDDGVEREGTVVKVSHEDHQALINNGVQEFWYNPEEITAIPLSEQSLSKLGFVRENLEKGVKYKKDSFRLVTPREGDFSLLDIWYREDRRHFNHSLGVHELQNLHLDMTKVHL